MISVGRLAEFSNLTNATAPKSSEQASAQKTTTMASDNNDKFVRSETTFAPAYTRATVTENSAGRARDDEAADKKELMSRSFDLNYRTVEDRLLCLSDLRNACAHYTRLFANPFTNAPKSADDLGFEPDNTLKTYLAVTRSLYPDKSKWENEFIPTIEELIHEYDMVKYMDGYGWKTEG